MTISKYDALCRRMEALCKRKGDAIKKKYPVCEPALLDWLKEGKGKLLSASAIREKFLNKERYQNYLYINEIFDFGPENDILKMKNEKNARKQREAFEELEMLKNNLLDFALIGDNNELQRLMKSIIEKEF